MAGLLAALGGAARFLRGAGPRSGRRIDVVESVALAPQAALHLVRVDGASFLVGSGPLLVRELIDRVEPAVREVELVVERDDGPLRDGS